MRTTACLLVALALQLASAPAALAADAPARKARIKVAVLDVKSSGRIDPKTFEGISSLISTELGERRPDLQVMGAAEIRAVIGFEKEKQLLGCSEGACLQEIGGGLGVQYLLATEGLELGGTWAISMSLIDMARANPVARVSKRTKDVGKLLDLCLEEVREVAAGLPAPEPEAKAETKSPEAKPAGPAPAAAVEAPKPAATATAEVARTYPYRTPGWALFGTGAVVAVAGAVCLGYSWSQYNSYSNGTTTFDQGSLNTGSTVAKIGVAGLGVGGAALATGIVLLLIPGSEGARVSLAPTRGGAYASVGFDVP